MALKSAADLTDAQRRLVRQVMERVGCLRCPSVVIVRGRNCNSYGCRVNGGAGCALLDKVLAMSFPSTPATPSTPSTGSTPAPAPEAADA